MRRIFTTTAFSLCLAGVAAAQQQTPPGKAAAEKGPGAQPAPRVVVQPAQPGQVQNRQPAAQAQTGQDAQWQNKEQTIADCVAIDNQTEITISKFAKDKLQNEKAQEFADMMVKDHEAFLAKLQKFSPNAGKGSLDSSVPENKTTAREGQPAARQTTAFRGDANGLDFMQIHREMAQQCITSAKKGLSDKKEGEVDACYIGWQIATHGMMKDKLTVLERHASGELAQVLAEGRETAEKHMKKAEELMAQLDKHQPATKEERQERREERREEKSDK